MIRYEKKYSPTYVLAHIEEDSHIPVDVDGDAIKMDSVRYKVFHRSRTCSSCGLIGTHFYKEKYKPEHPYHFNLYGVDAEGKEILFTKNRLNRNPGIDLYDASNFRTLCHHCQTCRN